MKPSPCASVLLSLGQEIKLWFPHACNCFLNTRSQSRKINDQSRKGNHVLNIPEMFPEVKKGHEYMVNYDEYGQNLKLLENKDTFSDPELFSTVVRKIKEGPPKKMIYSNFYKIENIGKEWLARNNYDNAISVFKINTDVFDWIAGPFDNLAHAYMLDGQYEMAVENYNKVLEISPDDNNAVAQLQQLSVLQSKSH